MSKTYFFTDLDDTLVQSDYKIDKGLEKTPVSKNKEDKYIGYSTNYQLELLKRMHKEAIVIPVTGRNKNALNRCDWKWNSYQVISHGAVVLKPCGTLDENWLDLINKEIDQARPILEKLLDCILSGLNKIQKEDINVRIIEDQGIPSYFCIKQQSGEEHIQFLSGMISEIIETGFIPNDWRLHVNGRNLAVLPPYASKARAVNYLKQTLGITENDLTIGLGDSLSDLQFMNQCNLWVTPTKSQINNFLQSQNHTGA